MNQKISKTNEGEEFFNALLDEVHMNGTERLRAKASFARAEAFADAVVGVIDFAKRVVKTLVVRPFRRLTTSIG